MDRDAEWVEFSHDAMAGPGPVRVRQNLDAMDGIAMGDDATARWVWPGARATAEWLCDRRAEWIEGKHVVELDREPACSVRARRHSRRDEPLPTASRVGTRRLTNSASIHHLHHDRPRRRAPRGRLRDPHGPPLGAPSAPCERPRRPVALSVAVEPCAWGDADAVAQWERDVVLCSVALYQTPKHAVLAGECSACATRRRVGSCSRTTFGRTSRRTVVSSTRRTRSPNTDSAGRGGRGHLAVRVPTVDTVLSRR